MKSHWVRILCAAAIVSLVARDVHADQFFSLSNPPYIPPTVPVTSNLVLHYHPDNIQVDINTNRVTGWTNSGSLGAAGNLSSPLAARRPFFAPSAINGVDAVQFTGVTTANQQQVLQTAAFAPTIAQPNTVFLVGKYETPLPTFAPFFYDGLSAGGRNMMRLEGTANTANVTDIRIFAGASRTYPGQQPAADTYTLFTTVFDGANSYLNLDGIDLAVGNTGTDPMNGFALGNSPPNSFGRPLRGEIAEVLVYDGLLTDEERNMVGTWLELRYGLNTAFDFEFPAPLAPEPSSLLLGGLMVVLGLGAAWWRRRQR